MKGCSVLRWFTNAILRQWASSGLNCALLLLACATAGGGCHSIPQSREDGPQPEGSTTSILAVLPEPRTGFEYQVDGILCFGSGVPFLFLDRSDVPRTDLVRSPFLCLRLPEDSVDILMERCVAPRELRNDCLLACPVRLVGIFLGESEEDSGCGLGGFQVLSVEITRPH